MPRRANVATSRSVLARRRVRGELRAFVLGVSRIPTTAGAGDDSILFEQRVH
jgi:hypothetical protein